MNKIQLVQKTLGNKLASKTFMLKKHSPEILLGVGIAGIVTSTVMACKATLKVEEVIGEAQVTMDAINDTLVESPEKYSEEDAKKDKYIVYVQSGVKLVKLYAPAIAVGAISIGAMFGSHKILKQRNLALVAAYNGVAAAFSSYRGRVIEEFGIEKDRDYRYGLRDEEIEVIEKGKNGKQKKVKKTVKGIDPNHVSQYARFFDDGCTNWQKDPEYNKIFLSSQQRYATDLLHTRGHLFLNEVYDMLGIPRSKAGAIVGWFYSNDEDADNFVDFGFLDESNLDFVNGWESSVLLDFNVQGPIYDLI